MNARTEDLLVEFGCGFGDVVCLATEKQANWIADCINWLAELTLGGQDFRPGDDNWITAQAQAGTWLGMAIFVMFLTFIVGVTAGAVLQRPDLIKRTVLASLVSLPAFYFSMFVIGEGLKVIDEFSDGLLSNLTDSGGFSQIIETMFDAEANSDAFAYIASPPIGRMLLVLVVMMISLFIIMIALAFRNFVLMILITFAPLAFVLLPAKGAGDEWVKRWMSAVTAMALAKPLIFGVLALIMAALGNVETIWSGEGLTIVIGFGISAFMPMLAYGFFQFMGGGGGGDDIGQRAGSSTSQKTQRLVSSIGRRIPNGGGGGSRVAAAASSEAAAQKSSGASSSGSSQSSKSSDSGSTKTDAGSKKERSRPGQGPAAKGRFDDSSAKPPERSTEDPAAQKDGNRAQPTPKQPPRSTPPPNTNADSRSADHRPHPPATPTLTRPAPQVPREPKR